MAQPAEMEEGDGGTLARRERGDGAAHALGDPRRVRRLVGTGSAVLRLGAVERSESRALLQRAPAQVQADADEPRPEALVVTEALEPDQRGDHRLLGGVGGRLGIARRAPAGGQEHAVVTLDERSERVTIARARQGDELRVRVVAQRDHLVE
jgi:hypothetical protein